MDRQKILIVEDDENLRQALADNLERQGYEVSAAAEGASARAMLGASEFHLVILDIMLPDTDGYALCKAIRAGKHQPMIMMLTARTLEDDLVRGFDAGADDYLEKPYRLRELISRVKALLRRGEAKAQHVYSFGGFRLDAAARKVESHDGGQVEFTRREFDLLHYFLRNQEVALTRGAILDEIWGKQVYVDERTVDNFVSILKKKLGWRGGCGFRIDTIRGVGYRMEVEPSAKS